MIKSVRRQNHDIDQRVVQFGNRDVSHIGFLGNLLCFQLVTGTDADKKRVWLYSGGQTEKFHLILFIFDLILFDFV